MPASGDLTLIAQKWLNAFNERDLEKLLSLYHDQAAHYSPKLKIRQPETNGMVSGKQALRSWWQDAFERLPTLHYKATTLTANDQRVFMEYIRQVAAEPDMLVAEVLEIQDGYIVASRVYHG
ncbi:SnoaL-like protein [Chitinophaga niastensis]|uniref:SnoaL-like protein n=1 Tax=Chitinophaga niastensis TaxID=536980 RepID=A0A2P8HD97_CHINA|nr:nuclear transport factor 2 family protein [Chitinophaga niastensis]PSL44188.1 SnoaL-like protein [Chitinophaga niastensis]